MIGRTLGHYRILDRLGTGGMGVVWLAEDLGLGRKVALKMLRDEVAMSPEKRARFEREARAVAALNHPNIVTLYAVEEADGVRFLAMEYVAGRTLDDLLRPGGLPAGEVLRIGAGIAAALDEAHRHGIVHRDLKPSNVLIGEGGRVKVVDFGLARSLSTDGLALGARPRETSLTQEGLAVGTLHYMSPEQLQNRPVDQRTDLFALGIVLYEMATGEMPFGGDSAAQVISSVLRDPPRRLQGAGERLPPQIADLLDALLAKEPADRPASAAEVRERLEAAQAMFRSETAALPSTAPGATGRPLAPVASGRGRRLVAAGLAVVAAAGIVAWSLVARRESAPPAGGGDVAPTIAVLPLRSFSGRPEYFVDGMTDELIGALARLDGVRVISRQSSMRYRGSNKLLPEIARELGADYLVEGTIREVDGRLRLQATVMRPDPEQNVWSDAFEGPVADVFALHRRVAVAVARAVDVEPVAAAGAPPPAVDPALYDQLLRAQYYANLLTPAELEKSNLHFRQVLDADPRSAAAWAGLALNYGLLGFFGLPADEAASEAERAVRRALELDPASAEAHATLGFVLHFYRWDWDGAERAYRRALELNPNDASSHHRRWALLALRGRWDEAERELETARRLDPLSVSIASNVGQHRALRGDREGGVRELLHALELEPTSGVPQMHLWWIYHELGRTAESGAALVRALRGYGLPAIAADVETELESRGYSAALERAAAAIAAEATRTRSFAFYAGELYAAAGKADESLVWLRRSFADRSPEMSWIVVSPPLVPLRGRPEFQELVRALRLPMPATAAPRVAG